jgi:hypothetical protein
MATPIWINAEPTPRTPVRRTRGRRAADKRPSMETLLMLGVLLAWSWGIYEVTLIFLK